MRNRPRSSIDSGCDLFLSVSPSLSVLHGTEAVDRPFILSMIVAILIASAPHTCLVARRNDLILGRRFFGISLHRQLEKKLGFKRKRRRELLVIST